MSDPAPAADKPKDAEKPAADAGAAASSAPDAPKPKRKGRWRRRLIAVLVVFIVLVVAFRLTLRWTLPAALSRAAASVDLDVRYDRTQLHLLGGDVGLWNFRLYARGEADRPGAQPILHANYIRGDIAVGALLTGRLHVLRAEADDVELLVERTADGRMPLFDRLAALSSDEPIKMDFTAPLAIEAVRLSHIRTRVRDAYVTPAVDTTVFMDLRLSDLGLGGPPARLDTEIWAQDLVDRLHVTGQASSSGQRLDANLRVALRGLRPKTLAVYLAPIGIRPVADTVSAEMNLVLKARPLGETPTTGPTTAMAPAAGGPAPAAPAEPPPSVAALVMVDGLRVAANERDVVNVGTVRADLAEIGPTVARVQQVLIEGVRASAARSSDGLLSAAGFELVPPAVATASAAAATTKPVESAKPSVAAAPTTAPAAPFKLSLAELMIRDVDAKFRDDGVSPGTDLRLVVRELHCQAKGGADALDPEATLAVAGKLELPGVAREVSIDGNVRPFAREQSAELAFRADGVRPEAIRPYLDAAGVQSLLNDATVRAKVRASIGPALKDGKPGGDVVLNAQLSDVAITDGADLLTFGGVNVKNATLAADGSRVRIESLEITGPSLDVRRTAEGALESVGVRLPGASTASAAPAAVTQPAVVAVAPAGAPAASQPAPTPLPRVEIGRLTWKGMRIGLADDTAQPPSKFEIDDAGVEISDLVLDLSASNTDGTTQGAAAKPGSVKAWLAAPGLADELVVEGSLVPAPGTLSADLRVRGRQMDLTRLASYLKPLGVEPVMTRGSLDAAIAAKLARDGDGVKGAVDVGEVKLWDGDDELVGLDSLHVADVAASASGIEVGAIEMSRPRISVLREADGAFVAAGVRVRPTTQPAVAEPVAFGTAPATQPTTAPASVLSLGRFALDGAEVRWEDRAVTPPVKLDARATVRADGVVAGRAAPPAKFDVKLSAKDVAEAFNVAGTLDLSPNAPAVALKLDARGLRVGPLAPYLPPGISSSLADGRLRAALTAAVKEVEAGGQSIALNVTDVDYRDAGAKAAPPLLAMKSFRASAPRIDLANDVIAISEVSLNGFEARAERDAKGATRLLGLVVAPAPAAEATASPASKPTTRAVEVPTTGPTTAPSAEAMEREIARLVAEARRPIPLLTLDKLDLNVTRLEYADASRPGSKPVTIRDLRLRNLAKVELGGPKADTLPPVKIELTTAIAPLAKRATLVAEGAPFAVEPGAKIDLDVSGITGTAVTDLMPDLAELVDGSKLTDGNFRTKVEANAKFDRRGPRDFDLSRGVTLDVAVSELAFRDKAGDGATILAGVESLQLDALRVEPKTGRVHAKVIEVNKPIAVATRDADGIHVLGMVIKLPAESTTQPSEEPAKPKAEETPATAPSAPADSAGEIRVDRLLVTGIDVRVEDRTTDPAMLIPLNNLDVEVRGFTTLALTEPRPIRFSVVVGADKVPLPKNVKGAGIAGAVGDIAGLVGGTKKEDLTTSKETEQRELFSQITSAGNLTLYPTPVGYVKSSVSGLELTGLRGAAAQAGVDIGAGVFDSTVEAYFRDDGSLDTRSRFVFTDLSVTEPANGPIVRHLKLPAPLDAVLGALRDADGSITVPLSVSIEKGNVNKGAVIGSATGALGSIIVTALASAPVKVVEGVGDLVGIGALLGGKKPPAEVPPVELAFGTGDATLDAADAREIAALAQMMRKDETVELTIRHEMAGGDVDVAERRANPGPDDALALAKNVRARKAELVTQRRAVAARARAELAALPGAQSGDTINQLRALDREIAAADEAADLLYDMLRPGAERQASRRTRAAALQIAQQRLAAIRDALTQSAKGVPLAAERIRVTNPTYEVTDDPAGGKAVVRVVRKKRS